MATMKLIIVLDNVRSTHNVGSIIRTAAGLGAEEVWCCGITPYPQLAADTRMFHIAARADKQIAKTALGAEKIVPVRVFSTTGEALEQAKENHYQVWALEQSSESQNLQKVEPPSHLALVVGHERDGVALSELESLIDRVIEIPMTENKESLNVSVAAAIAIYHFLAKN